MKRILTICALGAFGLSAYAQGIVSLQETAVTVNTNSTSFAGGTTGRIGSTANSYYFELLVESDPTGSTTLPSISGLTALSSWTDSSVAGTNYTGLNAGHVNGIAPSPGAAVNGWAAGTTNFVVVVGWSANEGTTWSQVENEIENNTLVSGINTALGYGEGYITAGGNPPANLIFGPNPGEVGVLTLSAVPVPSPEPATMALAAIGGASLKE